MKSAKMLKDIQDAWDEKQSGDLETVLKYNRQIWMMFYDTAIESKDDERPNDLRSNIVNLANFIFKRELDILGEPSKNKLDVLININKEIAGGLMTKPKEE